jgi:hypothetical protein
VDSEFACDSNWRTKIHCLLILVCVWIRLWSRYTKPVAQTPQFLSLQFQIQLFRKNSIGINNGKPNKMVNGIIRHFITTM